MTRARVKSSKVAPILAGSVAQEPLPTGDFPVCSSPSVLIIMCLDRLMRKCKFSRLYYKIILNGACPTRRSVQVFVFFFCQVMPLQSPHFWKAFRLKIGLGNNRGLLSFEQNYSNETSHGVCIDGYLIFSEGFGVIKFVLVL